MIKNNKNVPTIVILIYTTIFFLWWSIYELLNIQLFNEALVQESLGSIIKFVTWTVPVFFLLKKYNYSVEIPLTKMFTNKFKFGPYVLTAFLLVLYILIGEWIEHGSLKVSDSFNPIDLIGTFLFVGITEEMVFRGWLLNALIRKTGKAKAIVISSLLFLCIHFPIWIRMGIFIQMFTSGSFLTVLILSIIFSVLFLKSKNIIVPIFIHMLWDLILLFF